MPRPAPVRVKVDEQSLQVLKRLMGYVIHSYKGADFDCDFLVGYGNQFPVYQKFD